MDVRQAALAAIGDGRRDEARRQLDDLLKQASGLDGPLWLDLGRALYRAGWMGEGEAWSAEGLKQRPGDADLWNLNGVFRRRLGDPRGALAALERAAALKPELASAQINRSSVLMELGDNEGAAVVLEALVAAEPANPAYLHALAGALTRSGRVTQAADRLRAALALKPDHAEARADLVSALATQHRLDEALGVLDQGLMLTPDAVPLQRAKAVLLQQAGKPQAAAAFLEAVLGRTPGAAWAVFLLGDLLWDVDPDRGGDLLRRALAIEPLSLDFRLGLIQRLGRKTGEGEGASLEEAFQLAEGALSSGGAGPGHLKILRSAFDRVCAFGQVARLGDFRSLGRAWAKAGMHTALLWQLPSVRTHEDRLELLAQHRLWGDQVAVHAAANPIARTPRVRRDRIRLGFMSSDLRRHPVSLFARALFDNIDRERFELFAYSFSPFREDEVQARIAGQVDAFRLNPGVGARQAAQIAADDGLDILVELGGSTYLNKLEALAWKPAPIQASWLGYPHSSGLSAIDYFVCDAFNRPTSGDLLVERPLTMPHTWITWGEEFSAEEIAPGLPEDRIGILTFGTANKPEKYSPDLLRTWARIVAATPKSRFAFVRPEAEAPSFRRNVLAAFAAEGVGEDRVAFFPVWRRHMSVYNAIDITLDTFPLTGGTTTAESLWMGVPVVSLVGEAFYERMSWSILANAGLAELCAADIEGYVAAALRLAADRDRRRDLRDTLRERIRQSPLGRPDVFARDFYDRMAAIAAAGPAG